MVVVRVLRACWAVAVGAVTLGACKPEFSERNSAVTGLRVLAIQSDPAEASPRLSPSINYRALVADPHGPREDVGVEWDYCTDPKPIDELNDVSRSCFESSGSQFIPLAGNGDTASGTLPANGCRQYGPNPPEAKDGGLPGRPADPDTTGGYYQPVRVVVFDESQVIAVGQTRLQCDLAGATSEILREFNNRYRPNANPAVDRLVALRGAEEEIAPSPGAANVFAVARGEEVRLRASWAECQPNVPCADDSTTVQCDEPPPCAGAEGYVVFDLQSRTVVAHRESMRISWFATAGSYSDDRTGQSEDQAQTPYAENKWTAPDEAGTVWLWLVIRDNRAGTSWAGYQVNVQ
jgi:hypothetical protein